MNKLSMFIGLLLAFVSSSQPVFAGNILEDVPESVDTKKIYVFYLHGSEEEEGDDTDKYDSAVEAIAGGKIVVISELRGDTDPHEYADKVKRQVEKLQKAGVPKKNITISGFSKGAVIALAVAGTIQDPDIKYVLLAGCSEFLNEKYSVDPSKAKGRILAIYDSGDDKYGSCKGIIHKSDGVVLKEKKLNSGKGHALFRIPKEKFSDQWSYPLVKWAKKK
jgi:hypothetical protein